MSTKLVAPPAAGSAGWVGLSAALGALVHLLPIVTSGHGEGTGGQEEPPPSQGLPSNPRHLLVGRDCGAQCPFRREDSRPCFQAE